MGLIKALTGAMGGTLGDQWREFFYCDSLAANTLVAKGQKRISGRRSSNKKGEENIISNGALIAVNEGQCMIIVEQGNRDMMNEAYRVLRTNLDLMIGKKNKSSVMMFTSFNPNAGKTFSVMNIAASMALKDAKVMLVDLDLRKASLSKALGLDHSGVAAYLHGKSDSYMENAEEVAPNLFVLPVGTLPPNPTELLLTDRFQEMIEDMRQNYDYIFLDCPPIDIVADASIITEQVDMTVFVMRANQMDKKVLPEIEELYRSNKYHHMTMILNCVDIQFKKYGYGKSSYGYGYGNTK